MRLQPYNAAIAVEKRVNPGEAVMRGRGCENGLGLAEFAVNLFEALQEARQGAGTDGEMVADLNSVIAQRAGDHLPAFDPQQILGQQFAEAAMDFADGVGRQGTAFE